jgi:hypothetical protein
MNNEPVAWMNPETLECGLGGNVDWEDTGCVPLYTHPSEHDLGIAEAIGFDKGYKAATAKTLTDEEITELANQHLSAHAQFIGAGECSYEGEIDFARAILKKASEK